MKRIAVLGIGAMGSRSAQNLLNANYSVVVHSRTANKVTHILHLAFFKYITEAQ